MKKELEQYLVVKEQNTILFENNRDLKSQVEAYCDKFADFQGTLTKSNEVGPSASASHIREYEAGPCLSIARLKEASIYRAVSWLTAFRAGADWQGCVWGN